MIAEQKNASTAPVERSQEEKARILAHLQCMLAQARAMKGADHADA